MYSLPVVLTLIAIAAGYVNGHQCSRSLSRRVRGYVRRKIFPKLVAAEIRTDELPTNCPLNPSFDFFIDQEAHKEHNNYWDCKYCGKMFVNENYLDRHMDNKHSDKLAPHKTSNSTEESKGVCLADLCPAFGCSYSSHHSAFEGGDHFVEFSPYYYSDSGGIQDHAPDPNDKKKFERVTPCTNSEVQNNRKACGEIFESCFHDKPVVLENLIKSVCDSVICDNGILKGPIIHDDVDAVDEPAPIVYWLVQVVLAVVLVVFIGIYVYTSRSSFIRSKDIRDRYHTARPKHSWFRSTLNSVQNMLTSKKAK